MSTITIELCAEDRKRLDDILAALTTRTEPTTTAPKEEPEAPEKPATTPEQDIENAVPFDTKPEPVKPEPEPEPEPEKQEPQYTLADIRKKAQTLMAPATGKNAAVREIIQHFAPTVSSIPPERYAEVMQLLTALEEA